MKPMKRVKLPSKKLKPKWRPDPLETIEQLHERMIYDLRTELCFGTDGLARLYAGLLRKALLGEHVRSDQEAA